MALIFASLFFAGLIFRATFISRFFLVILEKFVRLPNHFSVLAEHRKTVSHKSVKFAASQPSIEW